MTNPTLDETATPLHARVAEAVTRLRANAKVLSKAIATLQPLAKPQTYESAKRGDAALAKARKTLAALSPSPRTALAVLDDVEAGMQREREAARGRLGAELDAACARAGLTLRVVSREPELLLRIAPLALTIDFDAGEAQLWFARQPLLRCRAEAAAIVAAHAKAMQRLNGRFDPGLFHQRCLAAWQAARAANGGSERIELLDALPFVALAMQPPTFRKAPTRANFRDYDRAQFAYDVLRLRRALGYSHGGWRLNLGVATGTTASQRDRVIYFEDEEGVGEFKLTLFFTREEATP